MSVTLTNMCEKIPWYQRRKEYCKNKAKEYYWKYREQILEKSRKYRLENKEIINSRNIGRFTRYKRKNFYKVWAIRSITSHRGKGFVVNITSEVLSDLAKKSPNCPYCGVAFGWDNSKLSSNSPSLDRINNENELRLDNIEIVCCNCNRTKGNRTKAEFISYCKEIVDKFNKGV